MVETPTASPGAAGMTWIRGGTFAMSSDEFYPGERPVRCVEVGGFWCDRHQREFPTQNLRIDTSAGDIGFRCVRRPA